MNAVAECYSLLLEQKADLSEILSSPNVSLVQGANTGQLMCSCHITRELTEVQRKVQSDPQAVEAICPCRPCFIIVLVTKLDSFVRFCVYYGALGSGTILDV